MNEIDRSERAGRVAARESANRIVVMLTLTAILGVVALLVTGSLARSATQANGTVSLSKTKLGEVLVNSKGLTLYMFSRDKNGKSSCSGSCAKFWPPYLLHGKVTAGSGVKASLLGTTRRGNGSMQVTYNKHPLYGFALDKKAGRDKRRGQRRLWRQVARRLCQGDGSRQGSHAFDDHPDHPDALPVPLTGSDPRPADARHRARPSRRRADLRDAIRSGRVARATHSLRQCFRTVSTSATMFTGLET